MFLLALIASLLLAFGLTAYAFATGSQAAIRAADREGMPERAQTNHPAHTREARVTSDASSRPARSGTCPASESDDLEIDNTIASMSVLTSTPGYPPSTSPDLIRDLALGVSHDWAGQPSLLRKRRAFGPDLSSCTASPRPRCCTARCKPGEAARVGATCTSQPALS